MTIPQGHATWSAYRDDPVEHVRDMRSESGNHYYECMVCRHRIWTSSNNALEDFLTEHDECAKEIAA